MECSRAPASLVVVISRSKLTRSAHSIPKPLFDHGAVEAPMPSDFGGRDLALLTELV